MPRLEPFVGLRYGGPLAPAPEVIAPPYDVVDDAERERLAARSPYNAIHVELPVEDRVHGLDRYGHAAALFATWREAGVLLPEDAPALYRYRMRFVDEAGVVHTTTGVIGALAMDVTGEGSVLPHEQTMPKPKGDRLDLLRATHVNTSPIWGLSLATGLADAIAAAPTTSTVQATDEDGVTHELAPIVDPAAIAAVAELVGSTPVVIADGHHRYETAIFFRDELLAERGPRPSDADLVMALVVELSPEELVVQAIHRLIGGLPADLDLRSAFEPFFEVAAAPEDVTVVASSLVEQGALGLVTRRGNAYLRPRPGLLERAAADLDSSRLDVALAALPPHELVYQHGATIVADAARSGPWQAAVLLRPATVAQIAETAHGGRRMPPKTTFFYPKPRTGMVYRSLDLAR